MCLLIFISISLSTIQHMYQIKIDPFIIKNRPGHNFIIKDLPSVLILIIADHSLNDSMYCVVLTNTTDVYADS